MLAMPKALGSKVVAAGSTAGTALLAGGNGNDGICCGRLSINDRLGSGGSGCSTAVGPAAGCVFRLSIIGWAPSASTGFNGWAASLASARISH